MRTFAVAVAALAAAVLAGSSNATLERQPMLVTVDGVAGVRPGMQVAEVNRRWGTRLRPVGMEGCRSAIFSRGGVRGVAYFDNRGFGAVSFSSGARTATGIGIGSSEQRLRHAYPSLVRQPDKYVKDASNYFLRRNAARRWWLRFDVSPRHRVTHIWFGNGMTQLVEGCS
ncbi:MAG: hypothetical protein ACXVY8_09540 [Gaiellaceae bacterium]